MIKFFLPLVFVCSFSLSSAYATNVPNFYGKLNVEYLQLSQEDKFGYESNAGAYNVRNSESRLGAKGEYEVKSNLTMGYRLEVGFDSTKTDSTNSGMSGRIRIRQAFVDMSGHWGRFVLGQTYTPTAEVVSDFDVLSNTSVGLKTDSQSEVIANVEKDLGYEYRSRKDMIRYTSPTWNGLKWDISVDRNDGNDVDHSNGRGDTYIENLLTYDQEFGGVGVEAHVGHIQWSSATSDDEQILMGGAKFQLFDGLKIGGLYSKESEDQAVSGASVLAEKEIVRWTGLVSYEFGKNLLVLTYGNRDEEDALRDGNGTDLTDNDKFSQNQLALGYKYQLLENIELKLVGAQVKHEEEDSTLEDSQGNEATLVAAGAQIKF